MYKKIISFKIWISNLLKFPNRTRYFLVFYIANTNLGQLTGQSAVYCDGFLNKKSLIKFLEESIPKGKNFVITGINEISMSEFNEWISK